VNLEPDRDAVAAKALVLRRSRRRAGADGGIAPSRARRESELQRLVPLP
jgi:hypothetical protein